MTFLRSHPKVYGFGTTVDGVWNMSQMIKADRAQFGNKRTGPKELYAVEKMLDADARNCKSPFLE